MPALTPLEGRQFEAKRAERPLPYILDVDVQLREEPVSETFVAAVDGVLTDRPEISRPENLDEVEERLREALREYRTFSVVGPEAYGSPAHMRLEVVISYPSTPYYMEGFEGGLFSSVYPSQGVTIRYWLYWNDPLGGGNVQADNRMAFRPEILQGTVELNDLMLTFRERMTAMGYVTQVLFRPFWLTGSNTRRADRRLYLHYLARMQSQIPSALKDRVMRTLATIREPVLLCLRRRDPSSPGKETLQLLLSIDEGLPSGWDVSNTGGIADDVPKGVTLRPRRWQPVTPAQKARLFPDGQSAEVESVVLPAALEFWKEVIQSSRANYWERLEPYKGLYFAELDSVPSGLGGRQFLDIRTEIRLRDGVQEESWLFPLPCPLHGPDGVLVVE